MLNLDHMEQPDESWEFAGVMFRTARPHPGFGLVIDGPQTVAAETHSQFSTPEALTDHFRSDYLHQHLLAPENRAEFFKLVAREGLVVCRNVDANHPRYRKVRGKSSHLKLSQAEYYHHDGCDCPQNPLLVEIRLPYQELDRNVATAVAPFPAVLQAMLLALPTGLQRTSELQDFRARLSESPFANFDRYKFLNDSGLRTALLDPEQREFVAQWDRVQGIMIRLVRREMDAGSCRAYYRDVDKLAGAYVRPWTMGESRLMLNSDARLEITMQHRRAYQKPRSENDRNGHLVKRWTAEEI
jgi:hypothetical protein